MKLITQILHPFKNELGSDYKRYHHHCQRIYQYTTTLLLIRESKKIAITAAFHDLGIWVRGSMDYLNSSEVLCRAYLDRTHTALLPDELAYFIHQHHKLSPIKGNIEAEAFRKADLIDLSSGLVRFNLPKSIIQETERIYPREKFTRSILKKTVNHAIKHPIAPLPMLKW